MARSSRRVRAKTRQRERDLALEDLERSLRSLRSPGGKVIGSAAVALALADLSGQGQELVIGSGQALMLRRVYAKGSR